MGCHRLHHSSTNYRLLGEAHGVDGNPARVHPQPPGGKREYHWIAAKANRSPFRSSHTLHTPERPCRWRRRYQTSEREREQTVVMAAGGSQVIETSSRRYLIIWPEKGGPFDLLRFLISTDGPRETAFLESSDQDLSPIGCEYRWVILVSIIARRIIGFFGKPMELQGALLEYFLNLLSENGDFLGLMVNLIKGKVVLPKRNSETFISAIGHLDERVDLYKDNASMEPGNSLQMGTRAMMDLCMMASKLAYENVKVIKNIVNHHWKMHFVEFFNGWNDFQKERATQVYILCDKPHDANLILISFRGTEPFDADDWSTDIDYSWYEIPKLGKVHMGFLEALGLGNRADVSTFEKYLLSPLEDRPSNYSETLGLPAEDNLPEIDEVSAYYAVRTKLKHLLEQHKNAKFVVTGHSLGGALAILFPAVLLLHKEEKVMKRLMGIYTFGQPRVGDRQLGSFMEAHLNHPLPRYYRVVYCNDLVPRLPYDDKTFLYKHFGFCIYYNNLYAEQCVDEEPNRNYFGIRHLIPDHLNAVWELIRALTMSYTYGPEYKEGWFEILLRILGLAMPGISAHSPTNYVNSIRLGREQVQMRPIPSSSQN
ncbi:triacylglycerol lipase OBL1 [Aristolochia californica]|uniref:triacylglycerol lipase OBL1 n=1 Tax=Aristolochia californica TaxID=171875 RepID=UPI0035DD6900